MGTVQRCLNSSGQKLFDIFLFVGPVLSLSLSLNLSLSLCQSLSTYIYIYIYIYICVFYFSSCSNFSVLRNSLSISVQPINAWSYSSSILVCSICLLFSYLFHLFNYIFKTWHYYYCELLSTALSVFHWSSRDSKSI